MRKRYKYFIGGLICIPVLAVLTFKFVIVSSDDQYCIFQRAEVRKKIEKAKFIFEAEIIKTQIIKDDHSNRKIDDCLLDMHIYKQWKGDFGDDVFTGKRWLNKNACEDIVGEKLLIYLAHEKSAPPHNKEYFNAGKCGYGISSINLSKASEDLELIMQTFEGE